MKEARADPTGFRAVLTDECWRHITDRHPEMKPFRKFVGAAIQEPDAIHLGKRDPTCRIYRKRYEDVPGVGKGLHLLVFVGTPRGYVKTAYLVAVAFRALGQQIWPSS
jgi:hypothetical protein